VVNPNQTVLTSEEPEVLSSLVSVWIEVMLPGMGLMHGTLHFCANVCACTTIACFLGIELLLQILYTADDLGKGTFVYGRRCFHPKDTPDQAVVQTLFRVQRCKGYWAQ